MKEGRLLKEGRKGGYCKKEGRKDRRKGVKEGEKERRKKE